MTYTHDYPTSDSGLTKEEEVLWFERLSTSRMEGDIEATKKCREYFCLANKGLVPFWAKAYSKDDRNQLYDELMSAGNEALLRGVDHFSPRDGRFSTIASTFIKNSMKNVLVRESSVIRASEAPLYAEDTKAEDDKNTKEVSEWVTEMMDKTELTEKERRILTAKFWENKTLEQIATSLGLTKQRIHQILEICFDKLRETVTENM